MQSEFAFINGIRAQAEQRAKNCADLICGIGDDAAVLREQAGRELLATTDLLVEDVDFKLAYAPPRLLGHKALAVSLSDIAAMGGAPRYSLLTLAIPRSNPQSNEFWAEFFAGYFALADEHGVALIGGDTSATPGPLAIDSIALGHCATGRAVRRNGARVGDGVYLTGCVGASAAGLKLLLLGGRVYEARDDAVQRALRAHLRPQPRVAFGRAVGARGLAHAMIDVSDGLAQDLAHICAESGVGAVIDFAAVPVADETALVTDSAEAAFALAVSGGEDFELLCTASPKDEAALFDLSRALNTPLACIGEIIEAPRIMLRRAGNLEPLTTKGYDHFAV